MHVILLIETNYVLSLFFAFLLMHLTHYFREIVTEEPITQGYNKVIYTTTTTHTTLKPQKTLLPSVVDSQRKVVTVTEIRGLENKILHTMKLTPPPPPPRQSSSKRDSSQQNS